MKKITFLFSTLLLSLSAFSQDARLVNLNYSLIGVNPSFAGSNGKFRSQVINRSEGITLSPSNGATYGSIDGYVKRLGGGIAISLSDNTMANGSFKSTVANLVYAPYFKCPQSGLTVVPSIQLSYIQNLADANGLGIAPPGGIVIPGANSPWYEKKNFDASAGLLINYKRLYVGFSAFHLNQPDVGVVGISRLPVKYSTNASYNIVACPHMQVNVQTIYTRQEHSERFQVGANALLHKHVIIGGGYYFGDVYYANLGYRHNLFTVTLSYDRYDSKLSSAYADGYELCASFNIRNKENRKVVTNFESW